MPTWSANSIWLTMSRLGADAGKFLQHRLGIEQIHLAGAAVLEEMDNRFGFRRKVGLLRFQVVNLGRTKEVPAE